MRGRYTSVVAICLALLLWTSGRVDGKTLEIPFVSHDGYAMRGKLVLPDTDGVHAVVVYVQMAEGTTVDMRRRGGPNGTFSYFDVYRTKLGEANIGFFSYEGRGIVNGDMPPRYEQIDRTVFNTSTLENKVRDALTAVRVVQQQAGVDRARIFLMGTSEGSLLAVEAASRIPMEIRGVAVYGVLAANLREAFIYAIGDGLFMTYRTGFDTDKDGSISKSEFDADPRRLRRLFPQVTFDHWDRNGDGFFTAAENLLVTKGLLDAVVNRDYATLDRWSSQSAALATPDLWFKDHFEHAEIWTFLSALPMPVGLFHGTADRNTPVEHVRQLEERAKQAGKRNLSFYYFEDLDHSLNIVQYFTRGTLPAGHEAMFKYIIEQAR